MISTIALNGNPPAPMPSTGPLRRLVSILLRPVRLLATIATVGFPIALLSIFFTLQPSFGDPMIARHDAIIRKFEGHTDTVRCVALSGNGKHLLTGSNDKTAILWETSTGKKVQTFVGHTGWVEGALGGDAKLVFTGSLDSKAILWDAASGKRIQSLPGLTDQVWCVAIRGDGRCVVTGLRNGTAILSEVAGGNKLQTFRGHTDPVCSVALSGDGKLVLTGSRDSTTILWDAASAKVIQSFRHPAEVNGAALSVDGKHVVTGSRDRTAILWDAASGKKLQTFLGHTDNVQAVALSGDGKRVLTGSWDSTAILWDTASGKKIQTFQGHASAVVTVALSGDGQFAVTGSNDKTAILWRVKAAPPPTTPAGSHACSCCSVHKSPFQIRRGIVVRTDEKRLWQPGQCISVIFLDGDEEARKKVAAIANEWAKYANISFRYLTAQEWGLQYRARLNPDAIVAITFEGKGYNSLVGRRRLSEWENEPHSMRLGGLDKVTDEAEWRAVVLHEFGHVLGLQHEHLSPIAGIKWNETAVLNYFSSLKWPDEKTRRNVLEPLKTTQTNYSQFDPKSIMMYPIPPGHTTDGYTVGWNTDLSDTDKEYIAKLYPKK